MGALKHSGLRDPGTTMAGQALLPPGAINPTANSYSAAFDCDGQAELSGLTPDNQRSA